MATLQVKICGVKTREAVEAAVTGGAAFIGFNFFRPSPRYVTPEAAGQLAALVPPQVKKVAVLADPAADELQKIFAHFKPDMLQLHGKEPPHRVQELKERYRLPIIKALPIAAAKDFEAAKVYEKVADYFLFEGKPPQGSALPGGNASSFDWKLLQDRTFAKPWFLAGGLNAKNVKEAVELSGATAVDISSGVERAPGEKDTGMIREALALVS